MNLTPTRVVCAHAAAADYRGRPATTAAVAPELRAGRATTVAAATLRNLLQDARLDRDRFGSVAWNPLGDLIPPGSRVVIKPNWVHHANFSGQGLDCLVTHISVVEAVLEYVAKTQPASVVIGDAPVQGCDFPALDAACGITALAHRWADSLPSLSIRDFRHKTLPGGRIWDPRKEGQRGDDEFVRFDLAHESELEPISGDAERFRVTQYDPQALQRTHAPGKHQYLVAREVMEADVVLNLPKLKTHKKACVTGALKNLVGINGLKDYLPHHRKGGSLDGGDCYQGRSHWKRLAESALDAANRAGPGYQARIPLWAAQVALTAGRLCGHDLNVEGSWHGNDTVWRMTLDLQRILRYGGRDGRLSNTPQRQMITITDAIVAGEGEGPLSPTPVPLGLLTLSQNPAAAEWVHALLMGFDPLRIPLVREALRPHRWGLANFGPEQLLVDIDGAPIRLSDVPRKYGRQFRPPSGWRGYCELASAEALRCSA